uniref:Prostaglandin E synthase 2 n=1 Tax=Chromera velia CCMP2878 TaxID=1169474 RepID=A0A0G4GUM1_9ALVE|eukprot:Cvel_23371.t1-p1 / transcript=Cvel_23371.t1 / gene=Cvel_23371 / organism=Chromera_velia_CCMP2878 / gene_product=Prostaglandin E synthase 2, putative / transcript_product=Prostaglandin E synthase 2, putative / location=Cvel_scaffold2400:24291-27122(-) / protein_length=391 / sequence_SO=supercontig / SO=protein_coding / is_pseudo=false
MAHSFRAFSVVRRLAFQSGGRGRSVLPPVAAAVSAGACFTLLLPETKQRTPARCAEAASLKASENLSTGTEAPSGLLGKLSEKCREAFEEALPDSFENSFQSELPPGFKLDDYDLELYQYESCPFCRKVRVCLDYLKLPYKVVEVHPLHKKELKGLPTKDYKKVPQLVFRSKSNPEADPMVLIDSKRIVHSLVASVGTATEGSGSSSSSSAPSASRPSASPSSVSGHADEFERRWIKWSDDVLVQLVVMNIYRTWKEASETFDYILTHPQFSFAEKWMAHLSGTAVMWAVARKRRKKYEVENREREAMWGAVRQFVQEVERRGGVFLGGAQPGEGDFAVFGILRSIEGFQCEREMFQKTEVAGWYRRMQAAVGESSALNFVQRGPSPAGGK